jgi:hypothetical protein
VFSRIFKGKLTVSLEYLPWFRSRENDMERRMIHLSKGLNKGDITENVNNDIWLRELALRRCIWCWYAERPESMGMWNNYGPHGVAIVSKVKNVRDALSLPDDALSSVGKVVYLPLDEPYRNQISPHRAMFDRPYYFKQEAYKYEHEIGFVAACEPITTGFQGGVLLQVDPKILIDELVISPHIVEDEAYSIRELLHSLDLLPRERIKVSLLLDPRSAFMRKLMERAVAPETYESMQLKYAGGFARDILSGSHQEKDSQR